MYFYFLFNLFNYVQNYCDRNYVGGHDKKGGCLPDEASPEGTVLLSHTPSFNSLSRISQLNIPGFSRLYSSIRFSTSGVATCFCV